MRQSITGGLVLALLTAPTAPAAAPPKPQARYGQIFIVGNESTPQSFILERVPTWPGAVVDQANLAAGERALAATCLFRPERNSGGYISLLSNPADPDSPFKDVQITVEELPHTKWVWVAADWTIHRPLNQYYLAIGLTQRLTAWASPAPERTPAPPR